MLVVFRIFNQNSGFSWVLMGMKVGFSKYAETSSRSFVFHLHQSKRLTLYGFIGMGRAELGGGLKPVSELLEAPIFKSLDCYCGNERYFLRGL